MTATYKQTTYAAAVLWLEDSQVEYAPNPKSGKSFHRYEAYSKAATVGQALQFGSLPQDLLHDYEKGFLAVSGPIREAPIDLFSVKNFDELTYVDKLMVKYAIYANGFNAQGSGADDAAKEEKLKQLEENLQQHRANMRRLAKIETARVMDIKEVDTLADKTGNFETPLMMARRSMANEQAKDILRVVDSEGRKVTDFEVLAVLRLWDFRQNYSRQNVMKEGQDFVYSDTVGLVADWCGHVVPKEEAKRYPDFGSLLNRWLLDSIPKDLGAEFVCTSININKNYAGKLHRDGNNVGPSFIKAFGDFQGGELNYFPEDDKSCKLEVLEAEHLSDTVKVDVSKGLLLFDGKRGHWVSDFEGERYTLVFFTCPRFERISEEHMKFMDAANFAFPTADKMDKVLNVLRKPRGYQPSRKAISALDGEKSSVHDAAYLFYPHASSEHDRREAHAEQFWQGQVRTRLDTRHTCRMELLHMKDRKLAGWNEHQKFTLKSKPVCKDLLLDFANLNDTVSFLVKPESEIPSAILEAGCCSVYSKRQQQWYVLYQKGFKENAMSMFGVEADSDKSAEGKQEASNGDSDPSPQSTPQKSTSPQLTPERPQKRKAAELADSSLDELADKVASSCNAQTVQKRCCVDGRDNSESAAQDLKTADVVEVSEKFQSDNAAPVHLLEGQRGTVKTIDENGDVQVHFHDHPSALQWVMKGNMAKLRTLSTPQIVCKKVFETTATKTKVIKSTATKTKKPSPALKAIDELTSCIGNAQIEYKHEGKTLATHPGSYERYTAYAKATTFDEALEFGARAADIMYDYQCGLIKIITKGNHLDGTTGRFDRLVSKWKNTGDQMKAALEVLEN
jgi:hypothetical protein